MDLKEQYISNKDIEDELTVMHATVNDMDGVKKEIEKFFEHPELMDNISNPLEKSFYEKMVGIYSNRKFGSNIKSKSLSLKNENKEAGFVSILYISVILIFLVIVFFIFK